MLKFWKRKRMSFGQAKKELAKLANGRYHVLRYEITETQFGDLQQNCDVYIYIHGLTWYSGETWRIALDKIKRATKPTKPIPVKIDDIPEMEIENED